MIHRNIQLTGEIDKSARAPVSPSPSGCDLKTLDQVETLIAVGMKIVEYVWIYEAKILVAP